MTQSWEFVPPRSRPTSAARGMGRDKSPSFGSESFPSHPPRPESPPSMLGPTNSLHGRSPKHGKSSKHGKPPSPDSSPSMLGPTDSLRGRSNSPFSDKSSNSGMLGLGPTDSLRGRSPLPDKPKSGILGLGPVDSLSGRISPTTPSSDERSFLGSPMSPPPPMDQPFGMSPFGGASLGA